MWWSVMVGGLRDEHACGVGEGDHHDVLWGDTLVVLERDRRKVC
jgi:hypothetical protein